jgi:hypothetical protein
MMARIRVRVRGLKQVKAVVECKVITWVRARAEQKGERVITSVRDGYRLYHSL